MVKIRVDALKVGDVIMPPPREVQLWMRRHCAEKGLPESALHLTIIGIEEALPDKRGRWIRITSKQTPEWIGGGNSHPFRFKARPKTPWQKL